MNLTHTQAREYMQLALDGRLSPERQAALRAHLAACPDCTAEGARLAALDRELRLSLSGRWSATGLSQGELTARLAGMEPYIRRKTMSQRFSPVPRAFAMMAIVILLVFGVFFISNYFSPQPGQPITPGMVTTTPGGPQPTATLLSEETPPATEPEPTAEAADPIPTEAATEAVVRPQTILPASLSWSPDSRYLAAVDSQRNLFIWNREQPGAPVFEYALMQEPDEPTVWGKLAWSPAGTQTLALTTTPPGLWLVDFSPDRSEPVTRVALPESANPSRGLIDSAAWSPDGGQIAYVLGGEAHLYDVSDGRTTTLTQMERNPLTQEGAFGTYDLVTRVAWSPDGSLLGLGVSGTDCPSPCNGTAVIDPAGGEPTLLFDMAWLEGWLPDGRLMIRNATGDWSQDYTYDCYAHDLASGETVNLTRSNPEYDQLLDPPEAYAPSPYQIAGCQAGPEGKIWGTLADFNQSSPGAANWPALGFVVVDPAAGEPQVYLPENGLSKSFQQFLADGRLAYAVAERAPDYSERWLIHSLIVDGQPVELSEIDAQLLAGGVYHAVISPDGRTLAALIAEGDPQTYRVEFIDLE